jgi:hypothetical protein
MGPACQRLEADQRSPGVEQRLVVQPELIGGDGAAQILLNLVPGIAGLVFGLGIAAQLDQEVDGADQLAIGVGKGMKATRLPSGRSARAAAPRIGRFSRRATAIGQS